MDYRSYGTDCRRSGLFRVVETGEFTFIHHNDGGTSVYRQKGNGQLEYISGSAPRGKAEDYR